MKFLLVEILKGNVIVFILYFISYIVENITGLRLLIWNLRQTKNYYMADGAATIAAIFYFVVNLIVLQVDLDKTTSDPSGYSFFLWLIVIIPLTVLFRHVHYKLTPKDPGRDNFDFSE